MKLTSAIALCGLLSQVSAKMLVGYFPNWLYANYPIEKVPVEKYTHINYAFAILNKADMVPAFTDDWAVESGLPKLVQRTHDVGNKVLLSVGGWTGSIKFSPMVATADSRKAFIDWNLDFISKYNTDGVDIDWEYPGRQAAGCNEFNEKDDAANFLLLLKELRAALDKKFPEKYKEITMAVHVFPFTSKSGYMKNVEDYVPYFDHINIMSYDINGAWETETGPNAPLYHEEGKGEQVSFASSIKNWIDAGVPASKINAGLAYYGRAVQTVGEMNENQYVASVKGAPKGDSDDAYWQDPSCQLDQGGFSGIWKWNNLRSQGVVAADGTAGAGFTKHWDSVSNTPWLFNNQTKTFISYEDQTSLQHKVDLALCLDLGGVMAWDIHQDNGELIDVVQGINGKKPENCPNLRDLSAKKSSSMPKSNIPNPGVHSGKAEDEAHKGNKHSDAASTAVSSSMQTAPSAAVHPPSDLTDSDKNKGGNAFSVKTCINGHMKCTDRGKSAEYSECVNGDFMPRICSQGTVCNTTGDYILCNHPTVEVAKKMKAAEAATKAEKNVALVKEVESSIATEQGAKFNRMQGQTEDEAVLNSQVFAAATIAAPKNNIPKDSYVDNQILDSFNDLPAGTMTSHQPTKSPSM